ncbi:MAG: TIGR01841 family phasin [Gammaproteobacteria bacterium]|nr:TIGR01841 family phasin [Gammaproteobacteria bacterium]
MQETTTISKFSKRVRDGLDNGASWVSHRKGPLDVMTEKTLKLNGLSHDSAARLVRQQAGFLEGSVDGAAKRLKTAAEADSFRGLLDGQIKLMPETRDRIVDDIRKTFEILSDTRTDLAQLFRETLDDLRRDDTLKSTLEDVADDAAEQVSAVAKKVGKTVEEATAH